METDDCRTIETSNSQGSSQAPLYRDTQRLPEYQVMQRMENTAIQNNPTPPVNGFDSMAEGLKRKRGLSTIYLTDCKRRKI